MTRPARSRPGAPGAHTLLRRSWTAALVLGAALAAGAPVHAAEAPAPVPVPAPAPAPARAPAPAAQTGTRAGVLVPGAPAPFLGVTVDHPANFDANDGLLVTAVVPQSTFDHLGVRSGDRLLSANGQQLPSITAFAAIADQLRVGDVLTLRIRSDTAVRSVTGSVEAVARPREISQHTQQLANEIQQLRSGLQATPPRRSLDDTLQVLRQLETDLPAMVDAFKTRYPQGRFNISIHIDILSDQTAEHPVSVTLPAPPSPGAGPAAAPAQTVPQAAAGSASAPLPAPATAPTP